MTPSDLVYCGHCGGASARGASECRFCGNPLPPPPPRAAAAAPAGGHEPGDDDPWADLDQPEPAPTRPEPAPEPPWGDPGGVAWRDEQDAALPPTQVGAWQAESSVPPVYGAPAAGPAADQGDEPTLADASWGSGGLIEPGPDEPRRGLPGWAWVATVVVLGTLLGVGAYILVDRTDDGDGDSVRTEQTTTSTSSTTSTSTTSTTSTTTTLPETTVPVVPATPPVTPPLTGPPTVPGAVTSPSTVPPSTTATTAAPTTPAPTTAAPTTPAPTTAAPTTPAPTTAAPTTTAPGTTVPGDLGIAGVPMSQPPCDGSYLTFLASAKNTSGPAMKQALDSFPGSHYLRTDQTCASLDSPSSDGSPLYRIFVGPFDEMTDACEARAQSTQGAFVKRASDDDPPAHVVECE